MQTMRNDHFRQIKNEKDADAKRAEEEIDSAVNAWKEKWSKELEKE